MCRAGGRRCPSHTSGAAVKARNARRRENYALKEFDKLDAQAKQEEDSEKRQSLYAKMKKYADKAAESREESAAARAQYTMEHENAGVDADTDAFNVDSSDTEEEEETADTGSSGHYGADNQPENAEPEKSQQQQILDILDEEKERKAAEKAAAEAEKKKSADDAASGLIPDKSKLPKVLNGGEFDGYSGEGLFKGTDKVVDVNPGLGIVKTENTGHLVEMGYYRGETVSGKINKESLANDPDGRSFGFAPLTEGGKYNIQDSTDLKKSHKLYDLSTMESESATPDEHASARVFTSSAYEWINEELYSPGDGLNHEGDVMTPSEMVESRAYEDANADNFENVTSALDNLLDQGPKRQRIVYRAMNENSGLLLTKDNEDWVDETFTVGEDIVFDGYQSSSPHPEGFKNFTSNNGVFLEILTPEGMNITSDSEFSNECETLLPRGARYKVVAVQKGMTLENIDGFDRENNVVVRLVAVNENGEILDGTN